MNAILKCIEIGLKSAGAYFPPTAVGVTFVSEIENTYTQNQINKSIKDIEQRLAKVEQTALDLDYLKSSESLIDLALLLKKAQFEFDEFRRKIYHQFFVAGCFKSNRDNSNKRIFLEYISQLDDIDLCILHKTPNKATYHVVLSESKSTWNCYNEDRPVDDDTLEIHAQHLISIGIIERLTADEIKEANPRYGHISPRRSWRDSNKIVHFKRTVLGEALYNYIKDAL